jgi:hypothetical protein
LPEPPGSLGLTGSPIVNANASGLDDEQIQSGLRALGLLQIGGIPAASAELDCGGDPSATPPRPGLSYCWAGGTGRLMRGQADANPQPFPGAPFGPFDPDGDGFGALGPVPFAQGAGVMLQTRAGADEIRGGDLLLARATIGGQEAEFTGSLATVFATVPAIAYYVDELGTRHDVSYPVAPGTDFPVVDGPDAGSDVSVTLTFWRPQRRALPQEAGNWIDIGGLMHFAQLRGAAPEGPCPESSYSAVEPELVPSPGFSGALAHFLLIDSVGDQAANSGNTFSYTLNLSQCRAFYGHSFDPGPASPFSFVAQLPPESGSVSGADAAYRFSNQP